MVWKFREKRLDFFLFSLLELKSNSFIECSFALFSWTFQVSIFSFFRGINDRRDSFQFSTPATLYFESQREFCTLEVLNYNSETSSPLILFKLSLSHLEATTSCTILALVHLNSMAKRRFLYFQFQIRHENRKLIRDCIRVWWLSPLHFRI